MEEYDLKGETEENIGLYINGINYSYSIAKSDYDKNLLTIKLYDSTNKSNIYYTYESNMSKLKEDIKFLEFCKNLDEIIIYLNDVFNKQNVKFEQNYDEYNLQLTFIISGITQYSSIKFVKHDIKNEKIKEIMEIKYKINQLENNYKDLYNKYEELKTKKDIQFLESFNNLDKMIKCLNV